MANKLATAVFDEDLTQVNSIVQEGVDLNIVDESGKTALMHAVEQENIRLVELLIGLGSDVNVQGHEDYTALHHAVDISIDGTTQSNGRKGEEPVSIIRLLLESGASESMKTIKGYTPLDIAKLYDSAKLISVLSRK